MDSKTEERAFKKLKKAIMEKPIVKIFDSKKEITLTIDASECNVSAILLQDHPGVSSWCNG